MNRIHCMILCLLSIHHIVIPQDNLNTSGDNQEISPGGLLELIADEMRTPNYINVTLPNNMRYLFDLLEYGEKTQQKRSFTRGIFRLFGNMYKGAPYVNAYHVVELLEKLPTLLSHTFTMYKSSSLIRNKALHDMTMLDRLQESTTALLHLNFRSHFEYFKNDPEKFLDDLSNNIVILAEEEISTEQVRQTIIRFLETIINKMIWSPSDNQKIWESVKKVSDQLAILMEYNIIDDTDDLNDILWTLTYRFCYFIDLTSSDLDPQLFHTIKNDIIQEHVPFLQLEEQEPFLESKKEYIIRTILISEAKRQAYQAGILPR
jgi:hypothetical protein